MVMVSNAHAAPPARQTGFTYIALLVAIAVMGLVQSALAEAWHTDVQREKEQELLFAGNQMRAALNLYYARSPAGSRRQPLRLEDLLQDGRTPATERYLRRIYRDPISGGEQWGLIRGASGEIHGVHSLSAARPLKQGGFDKANRHFSGAQKYSEWVFMASPLPAAAAQQQR
jgi:type II secretory pathway pseudopilin PulG